MIGAFQAGVISKRLSVVPMFYKETWANSYTVQGTTSRDLVPSTGFTLAWEASASSFGVYGYFPISIATSPDVGIQIVGSSYRVWSVSSGARYERYPTDLIDGRGKTIRAVVRIKSGVSPNHYVSYKVNNGSDANYSFAEASDFSGARSSGSNIFIGCYKASPSDASWQMNGTMKDICIFDSFLSNDDVSLYLGGTV